MLLEIEKYCKDKYFPKGNYISDRLEQSEAAWDERSNFEMSVVMIIVISALIQSFLTCIVIRKKNIEMRNYIENIILLWISFNYYILSVTKYYLGYKWENLLDSFWNAQIITFIHYSMHYSFS